MSHIIAIAIAVAIGLLGVGSASKNTAATGAASKSPPRSVAPMDAIPPTGL